MTRIKDQKFLTTFYRRFCNRGVTGRFNQYALSRLHVEVKPSELAVTLRIGDRLIDATRSGLKISVCDGQGSLIDLGWDGDDAWPMRYMGIDGALRDCDRDQLSRCIKRFLRSHGQLTIKKTGAA